MNGQMNRYKKSLKNTPKPVLPSELVHKKIDLKGLLSYAKSKNTSPSKLTEAEKRQFIHS